MNLEVIHGSFSIKEKCMVDDVSFQVAPGELVGLIGPNGAGKSTLLKLVSGELLPTSGEVKLAGQSLQSLNASELSLKRSVMSQSANVVFDFTVEEIIRMGWVQGALLSAESFSTAMKEVVTVCNVSSFLKRTFNTLSGGEQQRVQFARSLLQLWRPKAQVQDARYLLLDEPTASLDIAHELQLLNLLLEAKKNSIGVLIILHDLNLAARYLDKVVLLDNATIKDIGSPQKVLTEIQLSEVYDTTILVEKNDQLNRLVIHT